MTRLNSTRQGKKSFKRYTRDLNILILSPKFLQMMSKQINKPITHKDLTEAFRYNVLITFYFQIFILRLFKEYLIKTTLEQ